MIDNTKRVLVAVVKNKRDLNILLEKKWYRIPVKYAPKKEYDAIAFYQPALFKKYGKRIEYYGLIKSYTICKRHTLIDDGVNGNEEYYKILFTKIIKLDTPIVNKNKMRISFKFTNLKKLINSKSIAELFGIPDIEGKIEKILNDMNIDYKRELVVKTKKGKIYRLDFAVFTNNKKIDIECDGDKWHSLKSQRLIDKNRDIALKKLNWDILRLRENEIENSIQLCIDKIKEII